MTAQSRRPFLRMETDAAVTIVTGDKAGKVLSRVNAADVMDILTRLRAIMKRAGVDDAEGDKMLDAFATKCGGDAMPIALEPYRPYGGALSFADIDTFETAEEQSEDVSRLNRQFQAIFVNAINDPDLTPTQRAATIGSAASDLETRLGQLSQGQKGFLDRLLGRFGGGNATPPAHPDPGTSADATGKGTGTLSVFKDVDGRRRFLATWSNQFWDRDGQVFPEAAHKEYVEWADRTGRYPELRLWHVPYAVGQCDMVAFHEGFMLGSGTFAPGMEDVADALADDPDLGMSHGFRYGVRDLQNGAFHQYRTFEVSALPRARAANEGTAFVAAKEVPMLTPDKRAWLEGKVGAERVAVMEENTRRMRKELEAKGVGYKEYLDAELEAVKAEAPSPDGTPAAAEGAVPPAGSAAPASGPAKSEANPPDRPAPTATATATAAAAPAPDPAAPAPTVTPDPANAATPPPAAPASDAQAQEDKALAALTSAITAANAPVLAQLKALGDTLAEHDGKLNALKSSKDDDIASAWNRGNADAARAAAASGSDGNTVTQEAAKARTDGQADPAVTLDQFKDAAGPSSEYVAPYLKDMLAAAGNGIVRNQ